MKQNSIYTMPSEDIQFDDKYVVFNPLQNDYEYVATKESIKQLGQLDPILILDGKCVDGRHRVRAAKELGITVRCTDIPVDTDEHKLIMLCNKNVMSGRDYDGPQKAIQALRLVTEYGMKNHEAAALMKINRRLVSYAATIAGYGKQDILDVLMEDKQNRVEIEGMERPSRSLELIAKYIKASAETSVKVDDSERVQWNPDAFIKAEKGKAWYYEQLEVIKVMGDKHYGPLLAELANYKFRLDNTGKEQESNNE